MPGFLIDPNERAGMPGFDAAGGDMSAVGYGMLGAGGGMTNWGAQQDWFNQFGGGPSRTGRFQPGVGVQIAPDMNANLVGAWAKSRGNSYGVGAGLGPGPQADTRKAATAGTGADAGGLAAVQQQQQPPNQMLMDLYNNMQREYLNAKGANETRYGDILSGYKKRYADAMSSLGKFSDQDKQDANDRANQAAARTQQSAISRGLGNTTVVDSLQRGVESDRNAELRRIGDANLQRQLGYQTGLSKEELDFMERRNDTYPDQGLMAQIAMEAGKGGIGGAGPPGGGYGYPTQPFNGAQAYQQASAGTAPAKPTWEQQQSWYGGAAANPYDSIGKTGQAAPAWTLPQNAWRMGKFGLGASPAPTSAAQAKQQGWQW